MAVFGNVKETRSSFIRQCARNKKLLAM